MGRALNGDLEWMVALIGSLDKGDLRLTLGTHLKGSSDSYFDPYNEVG